VKVKEEFVIAQSPQVLWEFFEQVDRVAKCVPGVDEITVVDADNSRLRVTQSLGPMTATFDLKMRITDRDPGRSMQFTAVGRSVRGAAGNVRATHTVRLEDEGTGSTRVVLEGDLALGGMVGSMGQKAVAKQAGVVTQAFAEALQRELSNGSAAASTAESEAAVPDPAAARQTSPPAGAPRSANLPGLASGNAPTSAIVGGLMFALLIAIRWLRSRSLR
jgi:carbon monoxide dehydrogenase subunit G